MRKPFLHLLEVEALFPCRSRARSSLTTVANSLAKTGYAESELRDARSRLSPSADSQATAKRTGDCPLRAYHLPERDWTVALSALESDSLEIGEMALPLFESERIVTLLTAHSSFKPSTSRGFCSTKTGRFDYPKNGYPAKEPSLSRKRTSKGWGRSVGRKTIVSGGSSNLLFDPV